MKNYQYKMVSRGAATKVWLLLPVVLLLLLSCTSTDTFSAYYERFIDALELSGKQFRERYSKKNTDDSTPEASSDTVENPSEETDPRKEITEDSRGTQSEESGKVASIVQKVTTELERVVTGDLPSKSVQTPEVYRNLNDPETMKDAASYRSRPIEEPSRSVPSSLNSAVFTDPSSHIQELTDFLVSGIDDPFLQVKTIHDWIAIHIRYDTAAFYSGDIQDQSYIRVLKTKSGVCEGYANLFQELCRRAGLRCEKISGFARGVGFSLFKEEELAQTNHAWNAVHLMGNWYLIDATWDTGHVNGRQFERDYSTAYLFIPPEYMIYTHYPEDRRWQLLDEGIPVEAYAASAPYRGQYFLAGFKPVPGLQKLNNSESVGFLSLPCPEGTFLSATVLDSSGRTASNRSFVQHFERKADIYFSFPGAGNYKLRLFAGPGNTSYSMILEVGYTAEEGSSLLFPTAYKGYNENGYRVLSPPLTEPLNKGTETRFEILLPHFQVAYFKTPNGQIPLEKLDEEGTFGCTVEIPNTKSLALYGSTSSSARSYEGILSFPVQ